MGTLATDNSDGAFNPRQGARDFFFYTHAVVTLSVANPTATAVIQLDTDSDFYLIAMTQQTDITGLTLTEATNVIPLARVLITDSGSGKALMNSPVPLGALMGDGKRPYRFIRPRLFSGGSTIQLAYSNYVTGATVQTLQTVLHGYKRYFSNG